MNLDNNRVKPFLRWAGGKRWFIKHIDSYLPNKFNNYIEPFLGGGSIFFHLINTKKIKHKAILSDSNSELINTYYQICNNVESVISILSTYQNTENCYYKVRSQELSCDIAKAARFIYLNQTSYNGIFRVNRSGKYNVPYGKRKNCVNEYCNFPNLRNISRFLKNEVNFSYGDFEERVKKHIKKNDLIFLDPPYTVAHEDNGFIQYNQHIFSWDDQIRLAKLLQYIDKVEAYYIMTNAAHTSIADLFASSGKKHEVQRNCSIGGIGAKRSMVHEYIYTNIEENGHVPKQ